MYRTYEKYLSVIVGTLHTISNDKEMTLTELAHLADLSPKTVQRLYNGDTRDPKFRTIWKLARVMGLEPHMSKVVSSKRRNGSPRLKVVG